MNIRKIIFLLFFIGTNSTLFSQQHKPLNHTYAKMSIHTDGNFKRSGYTVFIYDKNGKITQTYRTNKNWEIQYYTIYNYDKKNLLISETVYSLNNTLLYKKKYIHDTFYRIKRLTRVEIIYPEINNNNIPSKIDLKTFQEKIFNKVNYKEYNTIIRPAYSADKQKKYFLLRSDLQEDQKTELIKLLKWIGFNQNSYILYQYSYSNQHLIYKDKIAYQGNYDKNNRYHNDTLHYAIRTYYNRDENPVRVEYYVKSKDDSIKPFSNYLQEPMKMIWYDRIQYHYDGRIKNHARFDPDHYARLFILYEYDSNKRLNNIKIYEGYIQFIHKKLNFDSRFRLNEEIFFSYKANPNLKNFLTKVIFNKKAKAIEVIIEDLPREDDTELPDLPETTDVPPVVISDKTNNNNTSPNSDTPETVGYKSWALPINKKFTALPYLSQNKIIYVGINEKKLLGINQYGQLQFDLDVDENVITQPSGNNDLVFFGTRAGTVYAIDKLGNIKWKKEDVGSFPNNSTFYIKDDLVIITIKNRQVIALNSNSGSEAWVFNGDSTINFSPVGGENSVYFTTEKYAYSLNSSTGKQLWRTALNGKVNAQPILSNMPRNNIYLVPTELQTIGLTANNGSKKWELEGIVTQSKPVAKGDFFYLSSDSGIIYKISTEQGAIKWEYVINAVNLFISGDDRNLYISHKTDTFIILDYITGEEVSQYQGVEGDNIITPIFSLDDDPAVYFGSEGMKLFKDSTD